MVRLIPLLVVSRASWCLGYLGQIDQHLLRSLMHVSAGQLQINQVDIDILVKTIPKGRHGMNDLGNITAAMTQAGLGLDNALLLAWDVGTHAMYGPMPCMDPWACSR